MTSFPGLGYNIAALPVRQTGGILGEILERGETMSAMKRFELTGKVALVTGAGSGIGRAICEAMAESGSDVVCADIDEAGAQETAGIIAEYGVKTAVVKADVSKQDEVKALFQRVDRDFGKLDILFNNAGITTKGVMLHEVRLEDWNRVIGVNLTGVFLCLQEGIKLMLRQKSGSIINTASVLGLLGMDSDIITGSNYTAAKHGVIGLTKAAAVQYAPDNIRVNAIAPGFIAGTKLGRPQERTEEQRQVADKMVKMLTPMKRLGQTGELKGLAVFLASDASGFITGTTMLADGGWCAW
ncbi:SDR family NAD(P)-dependent oxidoreductase [Chloroflexota bacterium]